MRVLLDTNILLDIVEQRAPFAAASEQVIQRCDKMGAELFVASHALATIFYLYERRAGNVAAWAIIRHILTWAEAAPLGDAEARAALSFGMADYEDALQVAAAQACAADWLITRDQSGFGNSVVPVSSPEEFNQRFPTE